jgi:fructose-1,6-bisphosphatase/inositol monophosphatase family enzyme
MNAKTQLTAAEIEGSLLVVQEVFTRFRPIILERAGKVAHTDKLDGSPVTDTDVEVEEALRAELAERFPGMRAYGEESGYDDNLTGTFWLIDPIDGTKSFIANQPYFTGMAVLVDGGEAVASVIYNTSRGDMYVAQKGKGAFKNGTRLDLSAVPLAPVAHAKDRFTDALNKMLQDTGVVCESGPEGGGYGFILVAEGATAARFNLHSRGYIHDYAPGALLVREAGGVILPVQQDTYDYKTRSFIACHPNLAPVLQAHLPQIRALENSIVD